MPDAERIRYLAELDTSLPMTGVGPNGTRYVIADGGAGKGTFTGSVRDGISAVACDR